MTLTNDQIDMLARELIDPARDEFSIALDLDEFDRVQQRADQIELDRLDEELAA